MQPVTDIQNFPKDKALNHLPTPNSPFSIHVDASQCWIGAILSQKECPIAYHAKKFSKSEANYTIAEKEGFSIYCAL